MLMLQSVSRDDRLAEGRWLQGKGEISEAESIYSDLLRRDPDDAEVLHLIGVAAHQRGDDATAIGHIGRAVKLVPHLAIAWQNFVMPLLNLGRLREAVEAGRQAVTLDPARIGPRTNYALALIRTSRFEEAGRVCEASIALSPDNPMPWCQLGHVRAMQNEHDLAVILFRRALAIDPGHLDSLFNCGVALQARSREAEAEPLYRQVLAADPNHRGARLNLGVALRSQGRVAEALAVWQASPQKPDAWPELAYDIACGHLLAGDWRRGWAGYDLRDAVAEPGGTAPDSDAPLWTGSPLPDGALLVHHEQGFGDTIQFVRLLPAVARRVKHVIFVCQPPLRALLASLPLFQSGGAVLVAHGSPVPAHTHKIALLSLPRLLDLDRGSLPRRAPYLDIGADRAGHWQERLAAVEGGTVFRVGLVWQGNPNAPVEKGRSIPFHHLATLGAVENVSLMSLQRGFGREQKAHGWTLHDPGLDFDLGGDAFRDTGAVLRHLDVLITSDTAMAHVAGAMGRPVWLLLKHVPDWRWGLAGMVSPWYPSMRVFRQAKPGDWDGLLKQVAAHLKVLAKLRQDECLPSREDSGACLAAAVAMHQAGRHADAVAAYRRIAASHPRALNLLGMALAEAGDSAAIDEALTLLFHSVALSPDDADHFSNLAVVLKKAGLLADSREAYAHALAIDPLHQPSHLNLVNLDVAGGHRPAAVARATALAARAPKNPAVLGAFASAMIAADRLDEARRALEMAVDIDPRDASSRVRLGTVLSRLNDDLGAKRAWEAALVIDPANADAWSNLGVHERTHGESGFSIWFGRRAVEADPRHAEAWCNLGIALNDRGETGKARQAFSRAVALRPDYADARMALGMTLLSQGLFEEGFVEYEWRLRSERLNLAQKPPGVPEWFGQDIRQKAIIVICEQGFGDAIQFIRYVHLLKMAGAAKVYVGCRAALKTLLASATGVDGVVAEGENLPRADFHVHVMSLPQRFQTRLGGIPDAVPYLAADPKRVQHWAAWLAQGDGFRVGLCWQGNPDLQVDRGRSIPLEDLKPLADCSGVRLISLQKGDAAEAIGRLANLFTVERPGKNFDEGPDAFADTAALMMNLDLVVTSDTAVAHLAGALGKPVWVLLKAHPEWRWLTERGDSPWYPHMRLFRQTLDEPEGVSPWAGPVGLLAKALARLVDGDRSPLYDRPPAAVMALVKPPVQDRFEQAIAAHRAGRIDAARAAYAEILHEDPDHCEALHMSGAMALQALGFSRALVFLRAARGLGLATPEFRTNLAIALRNLDRFEEAEQVLRDVIECDPSAEALLALGNLLRERERPADAAPIMRRAIKRNPKMDKAHRGHGNALKDIGRLDKALASFDRAIALAPDDAELRVDRAHARLLAGDLSGGFADYEWRWRSTEMLPRGFAAPQWDGRPLQGRTLLVHGEQGFGDHIQFARFLRQAAACGGSMLVEVRRPLFGLFQTLDCGGADVQLIEQGGPLPPHDCHVPMMSLPHVLGLNRTDLRQAKTPYLSADPDRVAAWRRRLDGPGFRVGLAWQGNPKARADKGRSPPLKSLAPLLACSDVRFVSLQKEDGLDQLVEMPFALRIEQPGGDFDKGPDAFLDTAAAMTALDLVITSDTATAHLAGALGRPTFLMLKHVPDWRWMLKRSDSPWYPTMRLFRQPTSGDWGAVARAIADALAQKVSKGPRPLAGFEAEP